MIEIHINVDVLIANNLDSKCENSHETYLFKQVLVVHLPV
jgi:hypothetical protein